MLQVDLHPEFDVVVEDSTDNLNKRPKRVYLAGEWTRCFSENGSFPADVTVCVYSFLVPECR